MKIGSVTFKTQDVTINGVSLHILTAGNVDAKPIICLHGFPDTPHTFIHQFPILIEKGFRLIVPFLRGYPPSQTGSSVDYFPLRLAEDVVEIIDVFCAGKATLLGHDWGGIAAYGAAQLAPDKINKMIVAAVPPFKAFEKAQGDLRQMWRSRYALLFQLKPLANIWMRRKNLAGLDWLWSYWSPTWSYTPDDIKPLKDCLRQKGAMEAATGYYRAAVWGSIKDRQFINLCMELINVPTLLCKGENDGCIGPNYFDDLSEAFGAEWRCVEIKNAGHFMHREKPEQFNTEMMSYLLAN